MLDAPEAACWRSGASLLVRWFFPPANASVELLSRSLSPATAVSWFRARSLVSCSWTQAGQTHVLVPQSFTCQVQPPTSRSICPRAAYISHVLDGVVSVSGYSRIEPDSAERLLPIRAGSYVKNGLAYIGCVTITDAIGLIAVNITSGTAQSVSSEQLCSDFHSDGAGNRLRVVRALTSYKFKASSATVVTTIPTSYLLATRMTSQSVARTGTLYVSCVRRPRALLRAMAPSSRSTPQALRMRLMPTRSARKLAI